jgi:hypothetical protein
VSELEFGHEDMGLLPPGAKAVVSEARSMAMPLWRFPQSHADQIRAQAMAERPPGRWFPVGAPGSSRPLAWLPSRGWYEWHWQRGIDPDKIRTSLPQSVRQAVIERDGYVCGLCGGEVEPSDVHIDHILPVAHGGQDVMSNLQVAHSWCNLSKGARI